MGGTASAATRGPSTARRHGEAPPVKRAAGPEPAPGSPGRPACPHQGAADERQSWKAPCCIAHSADQAHSSILHNNHMFQEGGTSRTYANARPILQCCTADERYPFRAGTGRPSSPGRPIHQGAAHHAHQAETACAFTQRSQTAPSPQTKKTALSPSSRQQRRKIIPLLPFCNETAGMLFLRNGSLQFDRRPPLPPQWWFAFSLPRCALLSVAYPRVNSRPRRERLVPYCKPRTGL